jgi:hypothetical protein
MKVSHREWQIRSWPEQRGHYWHAWVEVERPPWEDEHEGQIFHFFDIRYFDTETAAHDRAIGWARAWLDSNSLSAMSMPSGQGSRKSVGARGDKRGADERKPATRAERGLVCPEKCTAPRYLGR